MTKYKCNTTVKIRDDISTQANELGRIYAGNIVEIYEFYNNEGRIWADIGENQFCCYKDNNGDIFFDELTENNDKSMLQKNSAYKGVQKEGCCFLCACYLGGLNNIDQANAIFEWATKSKKVRFSDAYVLIDKYTLANEIAQISERRRSGKIVKGNNHFYVIDDQGNEIYNPAGPGFGH